MTARYEVIEAETAHNLQEVVNVYLEAGYRLQGGVATTSSWILAGGEWTLIQVYCQAVTNQNPGV